MLRRNLWRGAVSLPQLRQQHAAQIQRLPEVVQMSEFMRRIQTEPSSKPLSEHPTLREARALHPDTFSDANVLQVFDASIATFMLHVESRIASMAGQGFYTIGPCGEELLAPLGVVLRADDPMALHYRHLSVSIARQLRNGDSMDNILLNRARGYCVTDTDPVTGGRHCALGGGSHDYIVTSTLASQTSPAVGRALGAGLAHQLGVSGHFRKDSVSFVSLGDGSVNNGHFLGGENLAEFAAFNHHRVPVVFCITDNGLCISLQNRGYFLKSFAKKLNIKTFHGDGSDLVSTWLASKDAIEFSRSTNRPAALILSNITRRFGHAATDRQTAYLSPDQVKRMSENDNLLRFAAQVVDAGILTPAEMTKRVEELWKQTELAFDIAVTEPKIDSRSGVEEHTVAPLADVADIGVLAEGDSERGANVLQAPSGTTGAAANVMRKHMNRVFDEAMSKDKSVVYLGEDVRHGGYYIVTEKLAANHPYRVQDFPPEEGALVGAGMGYSQAGLLPIVEIPYAKYLDCGMDMFTEACIMNWLSKGKQSNGMVIRLQGFGRGVFGGNYHTHNQIFMPPGLDVICHTNGANYAKAMRYAIHQARHGRVVMSVDCTELLNMREVAGRSWEFAYTQSDEMVTFDDVFIHRSEGSTAKTAIVTYGNGIPATLEAQKALLDSSTPVDIIECPLLSSVPEGLRQSLSAYDAVLFADPCKEGQQPLASHLVTLMNEGALPSKVRSIAAMRTYNPLGNTITFVSKADVLKGVRDLLR